MKSEGNIIEPARVRFPTKSKCPCSSKQLALIIIPIASIIIFLAIFLPIFLRNKGDKYKVVIVTDDNSMNSKLNFIGEYIQFKENIVNNSFSTLTPEYGYDKIYIHLGDINETSNQYFDFFKSNRTFVPQNTKIIFLSSVFYLMKWKNQQIKY